MALAQLGGTMNIFVVFALRRGAFVGASIPRRPRSSVPALGFCATAEVEDAASNAAPVRNCLLSICALLFIDGYGRNTITAGVPSAMVLPVNFGTPFAPMANV